MENKSVV